MEVDTIGKNDKLYINVPSTRLLHGSKKDNYEFNNQVFPNKPHIHIIRDASLLYHCHSPMTELKIPKWDCILKYCSECPVIKLPYL